VILRKSANSYGGNAQLYAQLRRRADQKMKPCWLSNKPAKMVVNDWLDEEMVVNDWPKEERLKKYPER